jgi:hypothetical protein
LALLWSHDEEGDLIYKSVKLMLREERGEIETILRTGNHSRKDVNKKARPHSYGEVQKSAFLDRNKGKHSSANEPLAFRLTVLLSSNVRMRRNDFLLQPNRHLLFILGSSKL